MLALVRYVWIDAFRSQRWVAPVLSFGAIDVVISAQNGSALASHAGAAAALLFITTWLTVVVVNNEDPVQQSITEVCAASQWKVRVSKLEASLVTAIALGVLGMIAPTVISSSAPSGGAVLAGISAANHHRRHGGDLWCPLQPPSRSSQIVVGPAGGSPRHGHRVDPACPAHSPASRPVQRDGQGLARSTGPPDRSRDPSARRAGGDDLVPLHSTERVMRVGPEPDEMWERCLCSPALTRSREGSGQ